MEGNAFLRFGRSLFDAGAESSSILRSQRGILQQEQPMIVIDADDGQLMRYGRKKWAEPFGLNPKENWHYTIEQESLDISFTEAIKGILVFTYF